MNPIHRCLCHYPFIPVCDKAAVSDFAALALYVCFHLICLPQIYRQTRKFIAVLYHEKTVWFISYIRWITFTVFRVYLIRKDLIIIICIISLLRKKFFIIDRFRSLINDLSKFGVIDLHQGSNNSSLFSTYWEPFSLRLDNCLDL